MHSPEHHHVIYHHFGDENGLSLMMLCPVVFHNAPLVVASFKYELCFSKIRFS